MFNLFKRLKNEGHQGSPEATVVVNDEKTRNLIAALESVIPPAGASIYSQPDNATITMFAVADFSSMVQGNVPCAVMTPTTVGDLKRARSLVDAYS